jgi:hypothetical protein
VFVYVGGDNVVDAREVVAILDVRRLQRAPDARALWTRASDGRDRAEIESARALIVTVRGTILVSITPATVARRVLGRTKARGSSKAESQTGRGFSSLTPFSWVVK